MSLAKLILKDYVRRCFGCQGTGYYFTRPCRDCNNTGVQINPKITNLLPHICEEAGVEMFKPKDRVWSLRSTYVKIMFYQSKTVNMNQNVEIKLDNKLN